MKHSQLTGIVLCLLLAVSCFLPWSQLPGRDLTVSGLQTAGTSFGRPGLVHLFLAAFCTIAFALPNIGLKRINVLVAALNFAWSIRNYILVTGCMMGDCPSKLYGIWLVLACSAGMVVMSLLPKLPLPARV